MWMELTRLVGPVFIQRLKNALDVDSQLANTELRGQVHVDPHIPTSTNLVVLCPHTHPGDHGEPVEVRSLANSSQ